MRHSKEQRIAVTIRVFMVISGCVSEPFAHGLPCGKRVRWSSRSCLPNLTRVRFCQPPTSGVNNISMNCRFDFDKRSQLFVCSLKRRRQIARSNSKKAVSLSSACTTNRFPLSRCASAIHIVCPREPVFNSTETLIDNQAQLPSGKPTAYCTR